MSPLVDFSKATDENLEKLKEAILYVAEQSETDPKFGAIKLNKILYYADFEAHRRQRRSITGATYQHLREGPAPRQLLPAQEELEADESVVVERRPYFNRSQKRIRPLRKPHLSVFTAEEVAILDEVLEVAKQFSGTDLSEISHAEWGWKLTDLGETIPYESAWLSPGPLTQEQIEKGIRLWQLDHPDDERKAAV